MDLLLIIALIIFAYTFWIFKITSIFEWLAYAFVLGCMTFLVYLHNPLVEDWVFVVFYYVAVLTSMGRVLKI